MKTATADKREVKTEKNSKKNPYKQKASLFNFIIYTHEQRRIPFFQELADTVIRKFPCRIIFIKGNTFQGEDDFKTEISLKTAGPIACDYIEIQAGGAHLVQVPFYILPHLEPDLPIYLLWGQDPTSESEVLPRLVKFADRLIFDSECSDKIQTFSGEMLKSLKSFPCQILDMNWARLAGWRHVIASVMNSQDRIEMLANAKGLTITYNDHTSEAFAHTATQADYLQAWLATRLGWKYKSISQDKDATIVNYDETSIRLLPRDIPAFTPGSIIGFSSSAEEGLQFNIERQEENPRQVTVNLSTNDKCWLPVTMPLLTRSKGASFIQQLLYAHPSHHYDEMLETISNENLS